MKNIIYCEAAKMNSDGKLIGEVITLDTTKATALSANKSSHQAKGGFWKLKVEVRGGRRCGFVEI